MREQFYISTEHIAKHMRRARKKAGISQRDMCKRLGVSEPSLIAYEKGYRCPRADTFINALIECGCTVTIEQERRW